MRFAREEALLLPGRPRRLAEDPAEELDVVPRDNDWEAVLSEAMDAFLEWRRWSGSAPPAAPEPEVEAPQRPKRSSSRRTR